MRLAGRVVGICLALAAVLPAAPARAAQNCTLTRGGAVYCDGGTQPVRVAVTGKVVQLAASGDSTCALTEPGEVYCWPAGGAAAAGSGTAPGGKDQSGADQGDAAAEAAADDDDGLGFNPLILIAIGLALVGAGYTLVKMTGDQGARPRAASRHRSAPSFSRSA